MTRTTPFSNEVKKRNKKSSSQPAAINAIWSRVEVLATKQLSDELCALTVSMGLSTLPVPSTAKFLTHLHKLAFFVETMPMRRMDASLLNAAADLLSKHPVLYLFDTIVERERITRWTRAPDVTDKCVYLAVGDLGPLVAKLMPYLITCTNATRFRIMSALVICAKTPFATDETVESRIREVRVILCNNIKCIEMFDLLVLNFV